MSEENIQVIIRSRPINKREIKLKEEVCINIRNNNKEIIIYKNKNIAESFQCNGVYNGLITQEEFFNNCGIISLLDSSLNGFRSCCFAYGQTGSGKTHTIIGPTSQLDCENELCGILGRSLVYLYDKLQNLNSEYTLRVSCLELYQENVYDLLVDERERNSLSVREHPTDGFFVEGCQIIECPTIKNATKVINKALRSRQVGSHDYNHRSNRSHFILEILLELPGQHQESNSSQQSLGNDEYTAMGKMTFVDLAGSERLKNTNSSGKILQEAGFINSSLYVLGKVISGLSKSLDVTDYQKDIPFRDSKLTKLLISSLGGVSRTMMISCISEASGSLSETMRTLHFSMSAARIKNRPIRFLDPQQKLIFELRNEIKKLKEENNMLRGTLTFSRQSSLQSQNQDYNYQQQNQQQNQIQYDNNIDLNSSEMYSNPTRYSSNSNSHSTSRNNNNNNNNNSNNNRQMNPNLPHVSSHPSMSQHKSSLPTLSSSSSASITSNSIIRSKSQKELPHWNPDVVITDSSLDEKYNQIARDMFNNYLKYEKLVKNETKSAIEKQNKFNKPTEVKSISKNSNAIPHIKEGSARVIKKNHGPNPYTAHLRKNKSSQKKIIQHKYQQPQVLYESYQAPLSSFPQISPISSQLSNNKNEMDFHIKNSSLDSRENRLPSISSRDNNPNQRESFKTNNSLQNQSSINCETPEYQFVTQTNTNVNSNNNKENENLTSSPIGQVRLKLKRLENQLQRKRKDIQDNPNKANRQDWKNLEALEDEVRDMRLELQISEQLQGILAGGESKPSIVSNIDHFPLPSSSEQLMNKSQPVSKISPSKNHHQQQQQQDEDEQQQQEVNDGGNISVEQQELEQQQVEENDNEEPGQMFEPEVEFQQFEEIFQQRPQQSQQRKRQSKINENSELYSTIPLNHFPSPPPDNSFNSTSRSYGNTFDSLTYSNYSPIQNDNLNHSPFQNEQKDTTFLDTLQGEAILSNTNYFSPNTKEQFNKTNKTSSEDYYGDDYDSYSPNNNQNNHNNDNNNNNNVNMNSVNKTRSTTIDEYSNEEFEMDEYGEDDFESL